MSVCECVFCVCVCVEGQDSLGAEPGKTRRGSSLLGLNWLVTAERSKSSGEALSACDPEPALRTPHLV